MRSKRSGRLEAKWQEFVEGNTGSGLAVKGVEGFARRPRTIRFSHIILGPGFSAVETRPRSGSRGPPPLQLSHSFSAVEAHPISGSGIASARWSWLQLGHGFAAVETTGDQSWWVVAGSLFDWATA